MWAGNQGSCLGLGESWKGALAHTDEPARVLHRRKVEPSRYLPQG